VGKSGIKWYFMGKYDGEMRSASPFISNFWERQWAKQYGVSRGITTRFAWFFWDFQLNDNPGSSGYIREFLKYPL
jgi:hypothetical protein